MLGPKQVPTIAELFGVVRVSEQVAPCEHKRDHRFELRQEVGTKFFFYDIPFAGWVITTWWTEALSLGHR